MKITNTDGLSISLDSYAEFLALLDAGLPYVELTLSGWLTVVLIDGPVRYSRDIDFNTPEYANWVVRKPSATAFARVATDRNGRTLTKAAGTDTPGVYGRYAAPGFQFTVPAHSTVVHAIQWPFPLSIIQGALYLSGSQSGDVVAFGGPPVVLNDLPSTEGGPPLGPVLAAPILAGESEITFISPYLEVFVNSALIDSGYWEVAVADADGNNPEPTKPLVCGYDNTFESGAVPLGIVKEWTLGNAPPADWAFTMDHGQDAKITIQRWFIPAQVLDGGSGTVPFGGAARGGAPIPQLIPMLVYYTNNGDAEKTIIGRLDVGTGVPLV